MQSNNPPLEESEASSNVIYSKTRFYKRFGRRASNWKDGNDVCIEHYTEVTTVILAAKNDVSTALRNLGINHE